MRFIPYSVENRPGSTFFHQKYLPRLPIPSLQETLEKYLASVKPLLTPQEYERTKKIVARFGKISLDKNSPPGPGQHLQQLLIERDIRQPDNWLSDWWSEAAYLSSRIPIFYSSNGWMIINDEVDITELETISTLSPLPPPPHEVGAIAATAITGDNSNNNSDNINSSNTSNTNSNSNSSAGSNLYDVITEKQYPSNLPIHPRKPIPDQNMLTKIGYGQYQVRRAAKLACCLQDCLEIIATGHWPVDKYRNHDTGSMDPLCMSQYAAMFSSCRVPSLLGGGGCDTVAQSPVMTRYCIFMIDNQIYRIELYHESPVVNQEDGVDSKGKPLPPSPTPTPPPTTTSKLIKKRQRLLRGDVEDQINTAINHAKSLQATTTDNGRQKCSPPVGLLTAGNRDRWSAAYTKLSQHPTNTETFKQIQESGFVICLDDSCCLPTKDLSNKKLLTKGGSEFPARNRWWDKIIMCIIDRNGKIGYSGDHSQAEALPLINMFDCIYKVMRLPENIIKMNIPSPRLQQTQSQSQKGRGIGNFGYLARYLPIIDNMPNNLLSKMIAESESEARQLVLNSDSIQWEFTEFGTDWIKRVGKVSPDAFVQLALQLSYYRLHGILPPTYETASTRKYRAGRTETIRSLSIESAEFIKAMKNVSSSNSSNGGDGMSLNQIYRLYRNAAHKHTTNTKAASDGFGIDRHLLGLRMAFLKLSSFASSSSSSSKNPSPELISAGGYKLSEKDINTINDFYTDPAFTRSSSWALSTSFVPFGDCILACGYSCAQPRRGYGVPYSFDSDKIMIGIEGKIDYRKHIGEPNNNNKNTTAATTTDGGNNIIDSPETNIHMFRQHLIQAFRDMKHLCEQHEANKKLFNQTKLTTPINNHINNSKL
ncbi:hypothetical protein H4219_005817 [Mycoemilia scoparia]|uniref:Choline/carnitine acyltransferase domain-containing protein n=1 Tax=Mycoemilia scoparia TaxID=417184 RepID=A0A9W8DJ36_9FUNG|nr:hypothetical protein H4219_005817 [Mycoemilia scoparia]